MPLARRVAISTVITMLSLFPDYGYPAEDKRVSPELDRYVAEKFMIVDPDPLVEADRILILSRVISTHCTGIETKINILRNFFIRSGFLQLDSEKKIEISETANSKFDYLDVDTLAALCHDANLFFGPDGRLIEGLMSVNNPSIDPRDPVTGFLVILPLAEFK